MADLSTILPSLQFVGVAAKAVCEALDEAIDEAVQHKREEQYALMVLRKWVDRLKSDTLVYKVLLNAMANDTDLSGRSPYTRLRFIERYVMGLHILKELIMYTSDIVERKQWKALKKRSRLPE